MVEYASLVNLLNCSWNAAIRAFWIKYPNPYSKHVLTEDVLERRLTINGHLYTRRLLTKTNKLPHWGTVIFRNHNRNVCVVEESIVNPQTQTMTIYSWNTTYTNMMDVQERITISASEGDNTKVIREGWVDSSLIGCRSLLKKFGLSRWKDNAKKAHMGYQGVLNDHIKTSNSSVIETKFRSLVDAKNKAKLKAVNIATNSKIYS